MNRWMRFFLKRLVYMAITLFVIVTITFFLMYFLPGTPFNNQDRLT